MTETQSNIGISLAWKGDLRRHSGKEVQLHFDLSNADLCAVNFSVTI